MKSSHSINLWDEALAKSSQGWKVDELHLFLSMKIGYFPQGGIIDYMFINMTIIDSLNRG